jgi:hypothetical protein
MQRRFPLESVTVVDLGQIYNGSYATFLMAMAGARVIKIEPREGEHLRKRGTVGGAGLPFAMLNSNKQSVTLNLKRERGRELLFEMVRRGDVRLEQAAGGQPAADLCTGVGLWIDWSVSRLSGDGSDRAGDGRRDERDRLCRPTAG